MNFRLSIALCAAVSFLTLSCDEGGGDSPDDTIFETLDGTDASIDAYELPDDDGTEDLGPEIVIDSEDQPFLELLYPTDGSEVSNPVTITWESGNGVYTIAFVSNDHPLQDEAVLAPLAQFTYDYPTLDREQHLVAYGYDYNGNLVAEDEVRFTPIARIPSCTIPDQPGFNHYTVSALNDWDRFPRNGTYPYCWEALGDTCNAHWGQIYDGRYAGDTLFEGGGDCFCSGHTLEIFLYAYQLWREEAGVAETALFSYGASTLGVDSVDLGEFYQYWQGFGVAPYSSSADAFEHEGIGANLYEEDWDQVLPGDFVNLSRDPPSGHAVIFAGWIEENGEKVGLRYYGCNGRGETCADPEHADNTLVSSGPGFVTEYFYGHGGSVLPQYLFIGRVYMPVE